MATQPIFPGTIKNAFCEIAAADGSTIKDLISAGASGTKIESIAATNSDPATAYVCQISIYNGTTDYVVGEVNVPAGAGTNGSTKAADILNATDLPWLRSDSVNRYLYLASGCKLRAKSKATVGGSYKVQIVVQAGDF